MSSSTNGPTLYAGETLHTVNDAPTLTYFRRGDPTRPLCVAIPGAAHLARVFYGGHAGYNPKDFLAHWLAESEAAGYGGYNVLAISYPLDSDPAIMAPTRPDFTVREWGVQAAEITKRVVLQEKLSPAAGVILLVWSMGGKIIAPFTFAAREYGLDVRFAVSLAATPPLRGLRDKVLAPFMSAAGYVNGGHILNEYFLKQVHEQRLVDGGGDEDVGGNGGSNPIVPDDILIREYTGSFPIGLAAWGLRWSPRRETHGGDRGDGTSPSKGELVEDSNTGYEVGDDTMIKDLPLMCAIYGDSPVDLRHSAGDKSVWGFLIIHNLLGRIKGNERALLLRKPEKGKKVMRLIQEAPERLAAQLAGGHNFFMGQRGAPSTAKLIVEFEKRLGDLIRELAAELDSTQEQRAA